MAPFVSRIFLMYSVLNSFLLPLIPKKLRIIFSSSWYNNNTANTTTTHLCPGGEVSAAVNTNEDPAAGAAKSLPRPSATISPSPNQRERMDIMELLKVFRMFDENGDGTITKTELHNSLQNMGIVIPDSELIQMIEKVDVNGDGSVDIGEFETLYRLIMDERDEEEDMIEAFNVFDKNGDGFITVEELKTVLNSLGLEQGWGMEDCRKMIMKVDADGDGRVSLNEFKHMMKDGSFVAVR